MPVGSIPRRLVKAIAVVGIITLAVECLVFGLIP
jgi:hypothetical protein